MGFHPVKLTVSDKQQKQALKGAKIRLPATSLGSGQLVFLHPVNYKKVVNAKGGINLELSPGEIMATANHHGLAGSGLLDDIWGGLKSVGKWLKDSGVGSALADAAQTAATPFVGETVAKGARKLLKSTTGVGIATEPARGPGSFSKRGEKKGRKRGEGSGLYL